MWIIINNLMNNLINIYNLINVDNNKLFNKIWII
jgi:hypothetical protein